MSTKQPEQYMFINDSEESEPFDLQQTLRKYLYHWPYFVIGILVCLGAGFTYLQFAEPEYEIKATLLIQDEKKTNDGQSTLSEIDVSKSPMLVENEIEILKSRKLILQVVNDLSLWINYQKTDNYEASDLYATSPVKFTLLTSPENINLETLDIILKDKNTFILNKKNGEANEFKFNRTYKNNFGNWKIEPTADISRFAGSAITIDLKNPDAVADVLQRNITVELLNKLAPAVSLSLDDENQKRGKDILNRLIINYIKSTISEKNRITESTLSFIDKRLDSLSGELNATEKEVEGFRSSRGITDISSQSKVYLENVQTNDRDLNQVNVNLNVVEGIEKYVTSPQNSDNLPSVLGINDPGLNSLIERLSTLQMQKDKLLATTPEGNPVFDPINRQIGSTKTAMKENIRNIKSSLINTKRELQSFNNKFESSIRDIPGQERQLVGIKRQQGIKENLYVYLLEKREELSLSYASTLADARVVDNAYSGPVKSKKMPVILALSFLIGLIIPAGLIYAKDSVNNRITTRKEIETAVDIPILTELTFVKTDNALVVLDRSNFEIGEQFRSLRTNLHFLHGAKKTGRVTLLTSSISGEGKSFAGANLGAALAVSGRRTVILELDLRKPKISGIFNLTARHPGISDYLNGQVKVEDIIQASGANDNLSVIGCGTIPPNPSELLEQPTMVTLINWLSENYDDIILDTPPVQLVTDGLILSQFADVTLYMIRQGHTFKSLLPSIKSLAKDKHFNNMNILFNGIQKGKFSYGNDYGSDYYQQKAI